MFDFVDKYLPAMWSLTWWLMLLVFLGLIGFLIWNRKRQK
jgi:hypothetical protein